MPKFYQIPAPLRKHKHKAPHYIELPEVRQWVDEEISRGVEKKGA